MKSMKDIIKRSHKGQEIFLFFLIMAIIIIIAVISGKPFTFESLFDLLKSSSPFLVYSVCVLLVMLSGGIDVSFPTIAAVAAYITMYHQNQTGTGSIFSAFIIAGMIGLILGAVNAVLISIFNLPALIVTLATSNIYFGLLLEHAPTAHVSKVQPWISRFGSGRVFQLTSSSGTPYGLSYLAFTAILIMIIFALILKYTSVGRNIYALGSSREAAKRAGISITRTQFFIYCTVGFLSGIGSILSTALISYVQPFNINGVTMDVIASVVLGGAALSGGKGSIIGCFLGVSLIFLIKNSLVQLGIPSAWDSVIIGSLLIVSIAITMLRSNKE